MDAAKAALRNAKGELFPSLELGANGQTTRFKNKGSSDDEEGGGALTQSTYSFGAEASWEIDIFGRLQNAKMAAAASLEERMAYVQAVLNAGQEVNDILASQQYAQRAIALNTQQVEKLTEVLAATELRMQYDSEVNYLQVLLARQSLLEAQLSLLSNQYTLIESAIGLYRALGGGSIER